MFATVLALVCATALPGEPVQAGQVHRVGRIIIEGNDQTPDRLILEQLPDRLRPGNKLYRKDLAVAAERLGKCGFFPVNPWRAIGPTVEIVPNELDDEFLDIRVRVNERPGNWLRYEIRQICLASTLGNRTDVVFALRSLAETSYVFLGRWVRAGE
jgi:hypothetical protein